MKICIDNISNVLAFIKKDLEYRCNDIWEEGLYKTWTTRNKVMSVLLPCRTLYNQYMTILESSRIDDHFKINFGKYKGMTFKQMKEVRDSKSKSRIKQKEINDVKSYCQWVEGVNNPSSSLKQLQTYLKDEPFKNLEYKVFDFDYDL